MHCQRKRQEKKNIDRTLISDAISVLWQMCQKTEWMMREEEKRKEDRVKQWQRGLLVSGPKKKLQGEKKPCTTGKKTHAVSGCVEREMDAKPAG